jgi:hypothetical protein
MSGLAILPSLTCRKCSTSNPMVYFAAVTMDGAGTCICYDCAKANLWLNSDDNLKSDIEL